MRDVLFRSLSLSLVALFGTACTAQPTSQPTALPTAMNEPTIRWDRETLRFVGEGHYARIVRLKSGSLLICHELRGRAWVRRSDDNGMTWGERILGARSDVGSAANPELLVLQDGRVWLFWNVRPRDKKSAYTIEMAESRDEGKTWTPRGTPLYTAGIEWENGCWEPIGLRLKSGEIQVYFANEFPFPKTREQEISMISTHDEGKTWSAARRVCFRPGHRDGMPVPIQLLDGNIVCAIEDDGAQPDRLMKPAIFDVPDREIVGDGLTPRWPSLTTALRDGVYAGAPYLRQFPSGPTVLSVQSKEDGKEDQMVVYVGDAEAKHFAGKTVPFPSDAGHEAQWNSLFIKNDTTVTAVTGTTIDGKSGVWLIDGTLVGR